MMCIDAPLIDLLPIRGRADRLVVTDRSEVADFTATRSAIDALKLKLLKAGGRADPKLVSEMRETKKLPRAKQELINRDRLTATLLQGELALSSVVCPQRGR